MSGLGNKAVFAKNLTALMERRGIDRNRLCSDLDLKYTTVTDWCRGIKYPRIDAIERLANYFGVKKSDLIEEAGATPDTWLPVRGNIAAGLPIEAVEDVLDYEQVTPEMAASGEYAALRIKGQSMEPRMMEGDVVIVHLQETVESGDVAVVFVNGDEATVKKVKLHENGMSLVPFNPSYEVRFFSADEVANLPVRIWGKVVELRGKM